MIMAPEYSAYSAVIRALFSLQAFSRLSKKTTKQVADEGHLRPYTARKVLRNLEQTGLVGRSPRRLEKQAFLGRKVTGSMTTRYKHSQYLSDAARVQLLAQSNTNANARLGGISLYQLDMRNKANRGLFNAVVRALEQAGHKGLPTYGIVGRSFYWWLTTASRTAARAVIRRFKGKRTPP